VLVHCKMGVSRSASTVCIVCACQVCIVSSEDGSDYRESFVNGAWLRGDLC